MSSKKDAMAMEADVGLYFSSENTQIKHKAHQVSLFHTIRCRAYFYLMDGDFYFFGEMLQAYDWMTDLTESTNQKSEKFKKVCQKSKMITSFLLILDVLCIWSKSYDDMLWNGILTSDYDF